MRLVCSGVLAGLLAACGPVEQLDPIAEPYDGPALPWEYEPFPQIAEPDPAQAELGRFLFYDPVLSRDKKTACATCHSEQWGMSDGLPLSIGVDGEGPAGPGRTGPNITMRNSMTIWNAAFRKDLFWDGRSTSLEEQALMPLLEQRELDLSPTDAALRLAAIPEYRQLFARAFPNEPIVLPNQIARAIAAFERTLVSDLSPYDRYVNGDAQALSEESVQGMELFARAGCADCHSPPLFESNTYAARLTSTHDPGRAAVTHDPIDQGAFRVPTLRNLRETGPYFHDGSVESLEDAVLLESEISAARGDGEPLTAGQAALVATFLRKGLMDRTQQPSRPKTVPSGLEVPKDGLRIPR